MAKAASGTNNRRTVILGGVAVLVLGAAAGWFFYGDELLELTGLAEPVSVAGKPAEKPAAPAAAAKDAPPAVAAKPAAPAVAGAPAATAGVAKPAAPAAGETSPIAKPAAAPRPEPLGPDAAIAEIIKRSGADRFTREIRDNALQGIDAAPNRQAKLSPEAAQTLRSAVERTLAVDKLDKHFHGYLRSGYDPVRAAAFIDALKTPINEKMTRLEAEKHTPEQIKQFLSRLASNPPSPERRHVIGRIDTIAQVSEFQAEMSMLVVSNIGRAMDASGKDASARASDKQLEAARNALKAQVRALLFLVYRTASEAELNEYAALLESEPGRWGMALLSNAMRKVIDGASRELGADLARVTAEIRAAEQKNAAPAREAEQAAATARPAPGPAAQASAAPSLPADSPLVYARHNDLISAVTLGDYASARELLADGKNPDSRATSGYTALMVAVRQRDLEMAQILLDAGANPSLRATGGASALSLAQAAKHAELVRLLGRYGARP